jgi:hypothetical protein
MTLIFFFAQASVSCRIAFPPPSPARMERTSGSRRTLIVCMLAVLAVVLNGQEASAVRPIVTDDATVVYPGQMEVENFGGITMSRGREPGFEIRRCRAPPSQIARRSLRAASAFSTRTTK